MRTSFFVMSGIVLMVAVTGCQASRTINLTNIMPPSGIKDLSGIHELVVDDPSLELQGVAVSLGDKEMAQRIMRLQIASSLQREGFFRVADELLVPNSTGQDALRQHFKKMGFPHGYASISSKPVDCPRLQVSAVVTYAKSNGVEKAEYTLKTIPYKTQSGEIPATVPDVANIKLEKQVVELSYVIHEMKGTVEVKLVGAGDKVLYANKYNDLCQTVKVGGAPVTDPATSPTRQLAPQAFPSLVSQLVETPVRETIMAISPYRQVVEIPADELAGDAKALALLKAQAYSEVVSYLGELFESLEPDDREIDDLLIMAVALEGVGDYPNAMEYYGMVLEDDDNDLALAGKARIKKIMDGSEVIAEAEQGQKTTYDAKENAQH